MVAASRKKYCGCLTDTQSRSRNECRKVQPAMFLVLLLSCFGSFSSGLFKYVQHTCSLEIFTSPLKCFILNCTYCLSLFFLYILINVIDLKQLKREWKCVEPSLPPPTCKQCFILEVSFGASAWAWLCCTSIFHSEPGPPAWVFQHNLLPYFPEYGTILWFAFLPHPQREIMRYSFVLADKQVLFPPSKLGNAKAGSVKPLWDWALCTWRLTMLDMKRHNMTMSPFLLTSALPCSRRGIAFLISQHQP